MNKKQGLKLYYLPQPDGGKFVQSLDETSDYFDMLCNYLTGSSYIIEIYNKTFQDIKNIENGLVEEDIDSNECLWYDG